VGGSTLLWGLGVFGSPDELGMFLKKSDRYGLTGVEIFKDIIEYIITLL